jgi:transposase
MLSLRERLAVVNLYEELGSYRAVAALVGCDHKTVKAWIERRRRGDRGEEGPARRPWATDPFQPLIQAKVEATQGRIKSKPLLRVLRAAGYRGSLRTVQRALHVAREEWGRAHRRLYRPWQSAPGQVLLVDWGEVGTVPTPAGPKKLQAFCAVLGWSRWRYVRFFTGQRFAVLAQGLAGCFETLGGVPAQVLFDNPKTVTVGFVAGAAVLNPQLVQLATHYRFDPLTAAPRDPETKGKVEALVRFVKGNLPPDGFGSLLGGNQWAQAWCDEVNAERHGETQVAPNERLEHERPLLRPVPERATVATGEVRKVDRLSTIRFGSARYSVPTALTGQTVEVLTDSTHVRILHAGAEVALHRLLAPGGASIADEHYPQAAPTGIRPLRPRAPVEVAFLALGPAAEAYLRAAAAAGTARLQQQLARILELAAVAGQEPLKAALERATHFRRFGWQDVRSILAAGGAAPPDRVVVGERLRADGLPAVPRRELSRYRWPA